MTGLLPADEQRKLVSILGLLGSPHDGEVLAAANRATALLRRHGVSWGDLVSQAAQAPPRQKAYRPPHRGTIGDEHRMIFELCRQRPEAVTAWERKFLDSVAALTTLSEKQWVVLHRIFARVREADEP